MSGHVPCSDEVDGFHLNSTCSSTDSRPPGASSSGVVNTHGSETGKPPPLHSLGTMIPTCFQLALAVTLSKEASYMEMCGLLPGNGTVDRDDRPAVRSMQVNKSVYPRPCASFLPSTRYSVTLFVCLAKSVPRLGHRPLGSVRNGRRSRDGPRGRRHTPPDSGHRVNLAPMLFHGLHTPAVLLRGLARHGLFGMATSLLQLSLPGSDIF